MRRFWSQRVVQPILAVLRQDLTPGGVALSLAVGVAVGLFPVIGATTFLGLVAGAALRLNLPALQLANWLAYPLQLAMILPLVRLGEWLAGASPVSFSVAQVVTSASTDPLETLGRFGMTGLHGILGWMVVAPLVIPALYGMLTPTLRAARGRLRPAPGGRVRPSSRTAVTEEAG
jgi:uncharacterized protein (DUF2062 family)